MVPQKFMSEFIRVGNGAEVHPHQLHYLTVEETSDGYTLAPTQGMLKKYGQDKDGNDIWGYLRWGRRPFFLRHRIVKGMRILREYIDVRQEREVPEDICRRAEEDARTIEVFDRRHMRIDDGRLGLPSFETPGMPSDASPEYWEHKYHHTDQAFEDPDCKRELSS